MNNKNKSFSLSKVKPSIAYCMYDWANSPFATVVITFIFSAYFERAIVGDTEKLLSIGVGQYLFQLFVLLAFPLLSEGI